MFGDKVSSSKSTRTSASKTINKDQLTAEIRKKAQELYEKSGRKAGHDLENWLEAERIIKKKML